MVSFRMYGRNQKESVAFVNEQQKKLSEHRKRESALLANKPEVKRLSDLIVLEQRVTESVGGVCVCALGVCMCVYICVYVCVCVYVCLYLCVFVHLSVCLSVCVCVLMGFSAKERKGEGHHERLSE